MAKRGRPTKYKPEYCKQIIDFFDIEPYEDVEIPHYDKKKGKEGGIVVWTDIKRMPNKLPTLRDFAKKIEVCISNVYDWVNPEASSFQKKFCDAFTYAKEIRKWFLIQNGLQGMYNPLSFKFVAINVTDMVDRTDFTSGGEKISTPTKPLTIAEMKHRIKEAEKVGTGIDKKSIEGNGDNSDS